MTSFDRGSLVSAAGVDPWQLLAQLQSGDPAEIEALSAAFYRAGKHMSDAQVASTQSRAYAKAGYHVDDTSPLDADAEAAQTEAHIAGGAAHLPSIAKILGVVASDLDTATGKSASEVTALNRAIDGLQKQWETFWQGVGHHLPEDDWYPVLQDYVGQAVTAVKSHGASVQGYLSSYESTLADSLKSMADLGYIPPDALDEGPGDVNLDNPDKDAQTTVDAAKNGDAAGLRHGVSTVALVNAAIKANGGRVNDEEYSYLYQYYDKTAPYSAQIYHAVKNVPPAVQEATGGQWADGLLNLSRGGEQNTDSGLPPFSYAPGGEMISRSGLPPSVEQILSSDIGKVQLTPQQGVDTSDAPMLRRAEWKDGHWVVDNYDTDTGFANLLTMADHGMSGSDDFSRNLAEAGIRWKQDENAVQTNTATWLGAVHQLWNGGEIKGPSDAERALGFPPDMHHADPNNLDLAMSDTGASNALATAARNSFASAEVLMNTDDRQAVLGLNWHDGDGAAQLIVSGTAPDPTNAQIDPAHPGKSIRNEAALAVMQDTGSDYQTLVRGLSDPVKNALTTVAIDHLSAFASPTIGASDNVTTITLPDGRTIDGVQLSDNTSGNFLKMIGMLGPKQYGALHAAALEQGAQWIHDVPTDLARPGNSGAAYASNLDSRITAAGFAAASETAAHDATADHDAYTAELVKQQNEATHDLLAKVAFHVVDAGLDVATLGASEQVGKALEALSAMNGIAENAHDDYQEFNSDDANSEYIQHLQTQVAAALNQPHDQAQVANAVTQDQAWMAIRAAALNPDHTMTVGGQQVDVSSVIDANGRPYLPPGQLVTGSAVSPSVDVNDPHYQDATSNTTYHAMIVPLQDGVYGSNMTPWAERGVAETLGSTEGPGVSWAPSALTTTGDNKIVYWLPVRDPNEAVAGFEQPHDATPH